MTQSQAAPLPPPKERRRLREAHALTQAQVASTVGVTRETVRAWETGRTTPRGTTREAYARLLASLEKEVTKFQEVTQPQPPVAASLQAEQPAPGEPERSPLTPAQAFDALYAFCAPALVRQAYLLTGRRELARESVERAFQSAWQRWPEVATDRDPAGWIRATAYEYALSPWHRLRPRYRHPEPPPAYAPDRALLDVLLRLPPSYRRTLVLYDGVGLDLPETAAETESSTPAAANRVLHAREALATRLPELADPATLHRRLAEVASAERLRTPRPRTVRLSGERRASFWTRAAIAFTVAIIGATALTLNTAPTHYEPPVPPGATVSGVPPRQAPGALSDAELALRAKLRKETSNGPERLVPDVR
ncbi:helix-turn-helix domain-containing protein [Streptomyces acidiscabies]|uniref:Helix-turn-helix domain-containing protein n=1 Tax=Streptomyces acidiscabies TaxID=42234 RepID=A0AAP6BGK7_9ACTN|nr:helix-turn-helix domain-containing protein [Streptomyces acidiscabies]MBP5937451.1 helix-turn-helix domain-containing protein [Streptomyces sp. LBUM 1476]MBZ3914469.1 helix-turn-helix domain-containing protein [Streptomyces acidiscabies]MDX2964336.1 helix-turn-helix domain-containing protein [Streptomyces acidiscabies]MDX3017157.1 helix-turn-helix domain-containing protein [Streptomyces acidiscabies]MDX3789108.1 helix-turn-helix domain-containing protein [Streptomyces acidiscabies]